MMELDPAVVEAWLDDHPEFTHEYFLKKGTRTMVNNWLADRVINLAVSEYRRSLPGGLAKVPSTKKEDGGISPKSDSGSTGRKTPMRKVSAEEINPKHLPLKPMISKDQLGSPSFYAPAETSPILARRSSSVKRVTESKTRRISHYHMDKATAAETSSGLSIIDERDMIMELVKDIAMDLDITSVSHRILQNVSILLEADRCSLFLIREKDGEKFLVSRLFDVNKDSSLEDTMVRSNEIRIDLGQGIAGVVALTGKTLNIPEAYKDSRFNQDVDKKTGYITRSILCMPIRDSVKRIVGVAQVINKQHIDGNSYCAFTERDEKIFASYLGFCGIAIHNAQIFEKSQLENRRNEVLLDLTKVLFEEQSSLNLVMETILLHTTSLLNCERASVMLVSSEADNVFSKTFEHVSGDWEDNDVNDSDVKPNRRKVPFNVDITMYVRQTGTAVNIPNASKEKRFSFSEDAELGIKTHSLICMPIRNASHKVMGVIQLINKNLGRGGCFSTSDEQLLEAFSIFCGLGICQASLYEEKAKLVAKQSVVLEVLSYHAVSSLDEASQIEDSIIPSSKSLGLFSFGFDDEKLGDDDTLTASIRMFMDLNLIERFKINKNILCRWICSVRKNYRPVKYHNWRHAFNVCQSMFCMIKSGGIGDYLDDYERLSLLVSCLCHDLDHRGTNNAFQAKIEHPLARLYSTSTLEQHHYDQCLMLLHSTGCEILSHLSTEEYETVIKLIQHAIISTDLAVYFKKRGNFLKLLESGKCDWKNNEEHRTLLRGILITGCDIAAITKPWNVQKKVARLVAEEFFDQGDIEKRQLHLEPVDMMNRKQAEELPTMQIGFINAICVPLYEGLAKVSDGLKPMLDGCISNREHWETEKITTVGTKM
uniref:LOW QUALITY PROTEIN: cGMP-specific 3',5'-cyclic phosphodiesterase-like n=1 Tax=Styela clava TaxID=7725 RepID=UPI001939D1B5|nr:LOW QUALITY PROTEIN: cGMP-specific 3',5'-cyclic phosphodiesterase-like [Styela clava]